MGNQLVDKYKTMYGYSWVDAQKEQQFELAADNVCSFLDSIYGSGLDYFERDKKWQYLALEGMHYALNNAFDDFQKNYESELVALSNEGRVLNAQIKGTI